MIARAHNKASPMRLRFIRFFFDWGPSSDGADFSRTISRDWEGDGSADVDVSCTDWPATRRAWKGSPAAIAALEGGDEGTQGCGWVCTLVWLSCRRDFWRMVSF